MKTPEEIVESHSYLDTWTNTRRIHFDDAIVAVKQAQREALEEAAEKARAVYEERSFVSHASLLTGRSVTKNVPVVDKSSILNLVPK